MTKYDQIKLFEEKKVRAVYDDAEEKWYFPVSGSFGRRSIRLALLNRSAFTSFTL